MSELDETQLRPLDFLLSVNTLTCYLLMLVKKPSEALEFLKITERIAMRLLESSQRRSGSFKHLPTIDEVSEKPVFQKDSHVSGPLLSNYILAVNLMTSIAQKFADPEDFNA